MRWSRFQADLRHVLAALEYPALIMDLNGKVLHHTPALRELLEAEQDRAVLQEAVLHLLEGRNVPDSAEPRPSGLEEPFPVPEVRIGTGRFRLRLCIYRSPADGVPTAMLVMVDRPPSAPLSVAELRETFALTPTEARAALLLARGRSNVEVAEELHISPHTARRHTERVLQKLGVRSRAEIAGRVASRVADRHP